jgi:hypothetical protein
MSPLRELILSELPLSGYPAHRGQRAPVHPASEYIPP